MSLIIIKAHWGCNGVQDVTDKCKKIAAENSGNFIIEAKTSFNSLFGDPEPGKSKQLTLLYKYGETGHQQQQIWKEDHGFVNLVGLSLTNGGVLTLTVHRATNLRDSRTFGTQNPYAELSCGTEKFTTKVHDKGGKNATWNQIFTFNLDGKDQYMHVFIRDKEMGTDTVIGRLDVHLPVLCNAKGEVGYPVIHPNDFKKQCGELILTASFVDKTQPAPAAAAAPAPAAAAAAAAAPTVVYVQQPAPQPQVVYAQPQPQVVYQQPPPQQVVYQQPVVYQPPVVAAPAPAVVYAPPPAAPAVVYAAPAAAKPSTTQCGASNKQAQWRWCSKCMNMHYGGGSGPCAAGGNHDSTGSGSYHMPLEASWACGAQENWKWCCKCMCIAYAGQSGACAAGGSHDHNGSGSYYMCLKGAHGQVGWSWCCKCMVLFYGAMAGKSRCPATGGNHDSTGSGSYQVGHD